MMTTFGGSPHVMFRKSESRRVKPKKIIFFPPPYFLPDFNGSSQVAHHLLAVVLFFQQTFILKSKGRFNIEKKLI